MKILISLLVSVSVSASVLNVAQAKKNIKVTNYLDGFSYQRENEGEVSTLLVSKNSDTKSPKNYSLSLGLSD